ncbi:MAG: VOC family protein [Steroidobacteraceae bacterium]
MSQIDSYLFFDGNCAEAMRFYEKTLGGKLEMMMKFAESPEPEHVPPGSADRVMHACVVLDGRMLMASDSMPGEPYKGMNGFSLSLAYPTVAEARKVFDALAMDGKVVMPLEKTFWVESFGMLTDRFGTPWMVSGGKQAKPN